MLEGVLLGYALLMIGLRAAAPRGGLAHYFVIILFHVTMVLLVVVATSSYQYFRMIGTALDRNGVQREQPLSST